MLTLLSYFVMLCFGLFVLYSFAPTLYKKVAVKGYTMRKKAEEMLDNPIEEAEFNIDKAKVELNEFKNRVAQLMANNIQLKNRRDSETQDRDKYMRIATKAAGCNNESDAREALENKNKHSSRVEELSSQIVANDNLINKLRDTMSKHEDRLEDAETKSVSLKTRLTNVQLRDKLVSSELDTSGLSSLDDFEKKVEQMEALSDAKSEVFETTLADKYENDSNIESELASLMNKKPN